eukprot:Nk52_evm14s578 gene=Nk52_evmTU14s578
MSSSPSRKRSRAEFDLNDHPHRRFNTLNDSWILCSPHRAKRPWQGQQEKASKDDRPEYDNKCFLCPRNTRVGGTVSNPDYKSTFTFTNDFAALMTDAPEGEVNEGDGILKAKSARGTSRVVCFSPKHNLTIAEMENKDIKLVIDEWQKQFTELIGEFKFVQIFENKGSVMGCSNPHPHGQIWATDTIPEEPTKELKAFDKWNKSKKSCLLCDYVQLELKKKERIVCENEHFVVLVPFWAYWPFETLVLPKKHMHDILEIKQDKVKEALADMLKQITCKYDNLFQCSFPYSMGIHQAPREKGNAHKDFHMHFHFYPPLLRSASVKKFLVGYEMVGDLCRDITAEQAAERLRKLSTKHYNS